MLSHVWLLATPWTAARQASLSITNSWSLLKLMSIELVMPYKHLILCHPFLLPPSIFPSIRVFSNESVLPIRWPQYWSFSLSISPSNEYSGLLSFRMDVLDIWLWLQNVTVGGTHLALNRAHQGNALGTLEERNEQQVFWTVLCLSVGEAHMTFSFGEYLLAVWCGSLWNYHTLELQIIHSYTCHFIAYSK